MRVESYVAPAAENDVKPRSRVCRSEARELAASEQRRRDAGTARLEHIANLLLRGAPSARSSPFRAGSPPEPPPRSTPAPRPISTSRPARASLSAGPDSQLAIGETDDVILFYTTVRVFAPQRFTRSAGASPRRPSLPAHLMTRQFWHTRDKAWRGGAPSP
jgi:hypothetical protein